MKTKRTYTFNIKLKEVLKKRRMTQRELAQRTGLREATLSEMASGSRTVINKSHLGKVMNALDITKLDEILEVKIEEEV